MNVGDIMTREVDLIDESELLVNVARMMRDEDIGSIPVRRGDKLVGIVTDRDIVIRALADERSFDELAAKDAMTDTVLYCFEEWSVEEAAANMAQNRIRRLPVVNSNRELVGILSLGDICRAVDIAAAGAALGEISKARLH